MIRKSIRRFWPGLVAAILAAPAGFLAPASLAAQRAAAGTCPVGDPGQVVVGFEGIVVDEESEVALPGAVVRLEYEPEEGRETPESVTARTDEAGRYRFCELEAFREVRVSATYLLRRGEERKVRLERPRDVELVVDLGNPAFIVFTIVDAVTGGPVAGATIELAPLPVGGITDSQGRAAFRALPPGDYELSVRHIAFSDRTEQISLGEEQFAELRVELVTQAIAVAPLEVQITGRDPYLLQTGFYERELQLGEDGWFATKPDIEPYRMFRTLFEFKRELSIRFHRNQIVLINGRPMSRLGFNSVRELNELPYSRVRGIEAYSCSDAPDDLMIYIRMDVPIGDCNLIVIWTR